MKGESILCLIVELRFWALSHNDISNGVQLLDSPPIRHTIHDPRAFVAGEAQINEPFFVQTLRGFFQKLYLLLVVFDEVVIGGKNICYLFLFLIVRGRKHNS